MAKKLFVGGLPWATNDARLSEVFSQYGSVVSAQVISDRATGRSKGFGFVEMSTDEEANAAMQALNGQDLDGRKIIVSEARPPQPRENNFSGGGFGGGGYGGGGRRDDRRGGNGGGRRDDRRQDY